MEDKQTKRMWNPWVFIGVGVVVFVWSHSPIWVSVAMAILLCTGGSLPKKIPSE